MFLYLTLAITFAVILLGTLLYLLYKITSLPPGPSLWSWSGLILGHRGCRFDKSIDKLFIPENSLLSAYYGYKQGAHGIEVDVLITKDNQLVVMHDQTVNRMVEGSGKVSDLTLEEIQNLPYKASPHNAPYWFAGAKLLESELNDQNEWLPGHKKSASVAPSLEQIIVFCKKRGLKLMIETKEARKPLLMRDLLIQLYRKYDMYQWAYVACFNPLHIYSVRMVEPRIPTCLLYCPNMTQNYHIAGSDELKLPKFINCHYIRVVVDWLLLNLGSSVVANWTGCSIVGPQAELINVRLIQSFRQRGIMTDVWTVNNVNLKYFLLEYGCLVTTDYLFTKAAEEEYGTNQEKNIAALQLEGEAALARRKNKKV